MSRITVQHLEYLVALVAERHVTRAAERVGISQPAMSAALAKLRVVFRDPLLVRTTAGMEPTERALVLAHRARETVGLLEGSRAQDHFDPRTIEGHWRIMASEGVVNIVMPGFMERVNAAAPGLRFTVSPGDIRRAGDYLKDGELELALGFFRNPSPELRQAPVYQQSLVCIARKNHPLVDGTLSLEQFLASSHIVWGAPPVPYPALEALVDEALELRNVSRQVALRVSSLNSSAAIVARTNLLAVVPERIAALNVMDGRLQVLPLPFLLERMEVTMLWHDRWHHDAVHIWLRSIVSEVSKEFLIELR